MVKFDYSRILFLLVGALRLLVRMFLQSSRSVRPKGAPTSKKGGNLFPTVLVEDLFGANSVHCEISVPAAGRPAVPHAGGVGDA